MKYDENFAEKKNESDALLYIESVHLHLLREVVTHPMRQRVTYIIVIWL